MKNYKGAVLAATMGFMVFFAMMGLGVITLSGAIGQEPIRSIPATQTFWLAEGGLQKAHWDMKRNACGGYGCAKCSTCSFANKLSGDMGSDVNRTYSVAVVVNHPKVLLTSIGSLHSNSIAPRKVLANLTVPFFKFAAFAKDKLILKNNSVVDSYDSSKGEYNEDTNSGDVGDIGTNSGDANTIELSNNVAINGTASTGAGGTINTSNGVTITGGQTHTNNIVLPPVVIPEDLASADSSGTMTIAPDQVNTLTTGGYKYDKIVLGNRATLSITGDVRLYLTSDPGPDITNLNSSGESGTGTKIVITPNSSLKLYVDGKIDFNNNVELNNETHIPNNFIIYSTYESSNPSDIGVSIRNNSAFYGAIYAPDSGVYFTENGAVYGSVIGKTIEFLQNNEVHFDENLEDFFDWDYLSSSVLDKWREVPCPIGEDS